MDRSKGTALITGASSGIGAAYAERLAARGFDLVLVARRQERLDKAGETLRKAHGVSVESVSADLSRDNGVERLENLIRTRDDIELVINNAGLGALGPSTSINPESVDQLVRVNVLALTRLALAAVQKFAMRNRGKIVNIGSIVGFIPAPGGAAYSGSKAYVLNFTRSLQLEFANTGVQIQAVMPGPVRSEFFGAQKAPFPDHLFMTAETLVDAALSALDRGELICIPTLHDAGAWSQFEDARGALVKAVTQHGTPAARYKPSEHVA
jgi:uncharacterized protein